MKVNFKFLIPLIFLVVLLAFLVNLICSCNQNTSYTDINPVVCAEAKQMVRICCISF